MLPELSKKLNFDALSNTCVGFIPNGRNGIPILNSFIVTSFDDIENYFATNTMAKYA